MTTATALALVPPVDPLEHLTPREREVLALMASGLDNAAICGRLWITPKTLERHVQQVFAKLDLPPGCGRHRRVCAVLAYLRTATAGPVSPRNDTR